MIQIVFWVLAVFLVSFVAYLLSYLRFRKMISTETKQMIQLLKAENLDEFQTKQLDIQTDDDFSDLERAALTLRRKYLRLRKQSQEERQGYETVFSGLKEAIVTVDQNLKIISFNSSFLSSFNWIPSKNQPHFFLQDVIRDPEIIQTFKKSFQASSIQKSEIEMYQLFVTPLPSRVENESWCLGVFYDLSEIRKTEKIRVDFVANASHELRTPLTVIKGFADLLNQKLKQQNLNEEIKLLEPILESSDQMSDLMNELLNLSKVDVVSGLNKTLISTKTLTAEILSEVESLIEMKNTKVYQSYGCETVWADHESISQVLRNLLINAIKYSGEASEVRITWSEQFDRVLLNVKDNGPGIAEEHQARIFERFYRVDKGRSRDQGGFGLGLAMVKHHMLNHKGEIKLKSELGSGSEFICEFPKPQPTS